MENTRYINGIAGARCTTELKKNVRFELKKQLGNWLFQVFGFDAEERDRAKRFREQYPEAKMKPVSPECGLTCEMEFQN